MVESPWYRLPPNGVANAGLRCPVREYPANEARSSAGLLLCLQEPKCESWVAGPTATRAPIGSFEAPLFVLQ